MHSRRTAKAAQAIREVVSSTILFGLRDPRIKNVTVLRVEVTADLQSAKVYVSVLGDEKAQALTMHGLDAARGFLQSKVADRIQTRFTPILKFILDQGVKRSAAASTLLKELSTEQTAGMPAGERNAEIEALASLASGGRPGPLEPAPLPPDWRPQPHAGNKPHVASHITMEAAQELESHAHEAEEFTDDDDQPN